MTSGVKSMSLLLCSANKNLRLTSLLRWSQNSLLLSRKGDRNLSKHHGLCFDTEFKIGV